jgi:hypothetical protein
VIILAVLVTAPDIIRDARKNGSYRLVDNNFFTPEPSGSVYKNVVQILELDNVGE